MLVSKFNCFLFRPGENIILLFQNIQILSPKISLKLSQPLKGKFAVMKLIRQNQMLVRNSSLKKISSNEKNLLRRNEKNWIDLTLRCFLLRSFLIDIFLSPCDGRHFFVLVMVDRLSGVKMLIQFSGLPSFLFLLAINLMRNFENLNTVNIRLKIGAKKRLVVFLPLSIVFAIMGEIILL